MRNFGKAKTSRISVGMFLKKHILFKFCKTYVHQAYMLGLSNFIFTFSLWLLFTISISLSIHSLTFTFSSHFPLNVKLSLSVRSFTFSSPVHFHFQFTGSLSLSIDLCCINWSTPPHRSCLARFLRSVSGTRTSAQKMILWAGLPGFDVNFFWMFYQNVFNKYWVFTYVCLKVLRGPTWDGARGNLINLFWYLYFQFVWYSCFDISWFK